MYFAGLSTNFCHSMVAISAFAEKLWSTYTRFFFFDGVWVASLTKYFLLVRTWSESGPKETANSFKYCWVFVFAENRGMLPSIELLVFLLNELDVIVIVINGRTSIESWNTDVFSTTILLLYFGRLFCLYCYFSVLWWNNG